MGEVTMALGELELQRIGDYVRSHLYVWLNDVAPQVIAGPQLLERTVRVEEELKNLRETMEIRFAAVDERFEAQQAVMKVDFEAMDERFKAQQVAMKAGFDAMDERFKAQQAAMKAGFDAMNKRFDAVDRRFDAQQATMKAQQWIGIIGFAIVGILVSILGLAT